METQEKTARISIVLEIDRALRQIDSFKAKLDNLSIQNIKMSKGRDIFQNISQNVDKTSNKLKTLENAVRDAQKALSVGYYQNNTNIKWGMSDEAQKLVANYKQAKQALHEYQTLLKSVNEEVTGNKMAKTQSQAYLAEQKRYLTEQKAMIAEASRTYASEMNKAIKNMKSKQLHDNTYLSSDEFKKDLEYIQKCAAAQDVLKSKIQEVTRSKRQQINELNYSKEISNLQNEMSYKAYTQGGYMGSEEYKSDIEKLKTLRIASNELKVAFKEVANVQKSVTKETQNTENGFKNYQVALSKLERELAQIYHAKQSTKFGTSEYDELEKKLQKLTAEYKKLNKESVQFRKQVGISSSRGFYDLNSSVDYFLAKFRSKVTAGVAEQVEMFAMNAIPNFVDKMATFQQNRVNFAQVLPNEQADDLQFMNNAMRDFIKISSDYGASVQEVTEAGRLWGRQYKDVAIIQELVRNSTKLSITDDMSLVEVNKGLEATMQQYNIHLQNANEAQQVSGKIVDSWAKLADNAVVTASDLAKANEQSAGAAYQAGVGFDYLNAMIATMSSATGKAGAEIGRSIRSMLVSMRSNKAQKFFNQLGIATKELGEDGTYHVRSYEKVITELMEKMQTSNKDMSDVVLAMSGGKYQYNNVMALLKASEQMKKNLQTVRNSEGWADAQVGQQYATISRQIQAMQADIENLIVTLDEAGASSVITDVILSFRQLIQVLAEINPENLRILTQTIAGFLAFKAITSAIPALNEFRLGIAGSLQVIRSMPAMLNSTMQGVMRLSAAMRIFSVATGYIGIALIAFQTLYTLIDAYRSKQQEANELEAANLNTISNSAKSYQDKSARISELNDIIQENTAIINDSTKTTEEHEQANTKLTEAKKELIALLPKEAQEKVQASEYSREAIEQEQKALAYLAKTEYDKAMKSIQYQIDQTKAVIDQTQLRIQTYESEIQALTARNDLLLEAEKVAGEHGSSSISSIIGSEQSYTAEMLKEMKENTESAKKDLASSQQKLKALEQQQKDLKSDYVVTISGSVGSELSERSGGKKAGKNSGSMGGSSPEVLAEKIQINQYQRERNELWYDGSIAAKAYNNTLKEITDKEQFYGSTIESISAKSDLYDKRAQSLEEYKKKLEDFKNTLIADLDTKMTSNSDLAAKVGYTTNMTYEQKLRNIEVNKELYQQVKSYSTITNMISQVNEKLEDTKRQQLDIVANQRKIADELSNQRIKDIQTDADIQRAKINRPLNFNYDYQKNKIDLVEQQRLLAEYQQRCRDIEIDIKGTENSLQTELNVNNRQYLQNHLAELQQSLQQEVKLREETAASIAQLEYNKNLTIREGLYDVTQQFLIQGNSLKDIWNNLWKDLAREALQRLFQIKAQSSILGALFGFASGGNVGSPTSIGNINMAGWEVFDILGSHTGSNVGYPKMHTGGDVEKGRLGVVPKLKDDEVIRTLQVGEEVNSVSERRSNEILATVAMKAIDAQTQKPQNINITAIDSRSFAEYLNDNADVLTAILAKQGALGRRG